MARKTRRAVRVQSKDGSLYIRHPKEMVKKWNHGKGDHVEVLFDDKEAVIRKI